MEKLVRLLWFGLMPVMVLVELAGAVWSIKTVAFTGTEAEYGNKR